MDQPPGERLLPVRRQRHAQQAAGIAQSEGRRRLPDHRRPIAELRRLDRYVQLHRRLQRQRPGGYAARLPAEHEQHSAEHAARWLRPLRVRLRAGRLARDQQADDQLRRPHRARVGPAGTQQPVRGQLRPERGEPAQYQRHGDRSGHRRAPSDHGRPGVRRPEWRAGRAGQPAGDQSRAARRRGVQPRRQDGDPRRLGPVLLAVELPGGGHQRLGPDRLLVADQRAPGLVGRADRLVEQSVPGRRRPAERQHARPADRHRRRHLLRRSEPRRAARPAVLGRFPA